jgi:hypothetical protein
MFRQQALIVARRVVFAARLGNESFKCWWKHFRIARAIAQRIRIWRIALVCRFRFLPNTTTGVSDHMNTKMILAAIALSLSLAACAKKEEAAPADTAPAAEAPAAAPAETTPPADAAPMDAAPAGDAAAPAETPPAEEAPKQ